jgi:dephospho-CoA kinase
MVKKQSFSIIGLVGGIASGKSTITKHFANLGAKIIDADKISHKALEDETVQKSIVHYFGSEVLYDGKIDRKILGTKVFGSENQKHLRFLEELIHPIVRQKVASRVESWQNDYTIILDIPLLWKSPWQDRCDYIIFIDASFDTRLSRVKKHRKWTRQNLQDREKQQLSIAEKKKIAHFTIVNETTEMDVANQVQNIWEKIQS